MRTLTYMRRCWTFLMMDPATTKLIVLQGSACVAGATTPVCIPAHWLLRQTLAECLRRRGEQEIPGGHASATGMATRNQAA